uniref:NADH dehydrogenase subunit 2 n=1 Tax=Lambis lambis TaxID=387446 RepID=UPI00233F776A|nr:NADH dehydrogenase subunit 2 [Lambis lambis]WBU92599.1 NADH dehydrogenase subunit 2 [Lambis lambis]WBU92612.1 NADH dehydrogenase subunit 2 [Lambis lambis]
MFSSLPFSYMFVFTMMAGTLFSVSSSHWLGIWAGLEINLIGFLPLLVYQKSMAESESAVKYFVVQALGSSLLMFGSLSSYALSFSWDISIVSSYYIFSIFILCCGLCMKMGLFPFHFWLPSVMAGLPWISCLLLATWQKFAPVFLMSSLLDVNLVYWMILLISFMCAGSSIMGGVGGMNQTQIRALLAYSSIGHLGWIVFSVMYSDWAMKVYLGIYVFISICVFISLWYMDLSNMKSLVKFNQKKALETGIMVMLLSLGGLPPLLGFISKWLVVSVSMSSSLWGVLFLLILGSIMSLFYYLSLFFSMFLSETSKSLLLFKKDIKLMLLINMIIIVNIAGGLLLTMSGVLMNL